MPRIVEHKGRVQAWKNPDDGVQHLVYGNFQPHRLGCRMAQMWGYYPRFVDITLIDCEMCLQSATK